MTSHKVAIVPITAEIIAAAERDSVGRCMISEAIKAAIPGVSRVETDMQTIRWTRDGERETYFTPWDAQNALVRFDGGDPIEPFTLRLRYEQRIILQRDLTTESGKTVNATARKAKRAKVRAEAAAVDPDITATKRQKLAEAAVAAEAEAVEARAKATRPLRRRNRPPSRVETDTERGVARGIKTSRTGRRTFGQRVMRANQPDARVDRGYDD